MSNLEAQTGPRFHGPPQMGDIVDLSGAAWHKSKRSSSNGCVEVAFVDGHVAVRDSKNRDGSVLIFTPIEWEAFIGGIGDGQFRLPKDFVSA
jgi:prepilin-type processing-associated H-X9-DG protein